MNVLLTPQPPLFPHQHQQHDPPRRSPSRSMSPFPNMASKKRKADDDEEMGISPMSSPAIQNRQLSRPSKKIRSHAEVAGRPLGLPRLLETLDASQLRTVLRTICERQPEIGEEVVRSAPRPTVACALSVLHEYQDKLREAFPYGGSSSDYTYYRVKQPLVALLDALSDFISQYLPPHETQASVSLEFLDGATKIAHTLPDWESQAYRYHKDNIYDELSRAWALVVNEASKKGAGFVLHSGGWDQILAKHNQESNGRLGAAINAMRSNVGWVGGSASAAAAAPAANPSILDQLMAGNFSSPVRVGPW